jgi:HSP20 family protein
MATLTRREPFGLDFPRWMTRMFEDRPFEGLFEPPLRIEEYVDDGTLVVRAEMPGVDVDKDVQISVHDGMLHIEAERVEKEEKKDKTFFRSEFHYGAFERTVPLPAGSTVDDVKATYKDGVLEIRIPTRSLASEATKVPVQRVE